MKPDIHLTPWALPQEVKTLEVNGHEMAYIEHGRGDPLVLVHGSLNDYRAWACQIATFSSNYRTIAVSLRCFDPELPHSEGEDFSVQRHAEDLASFVKSLKTGPIHLIGHSRGGDVALILARHLRCTASCSAQKRKTSRVPCRSRAGTSQRPCLACQTSQPLAISAAA